MNLNYQNNALGSDKQILDEFIELLKAGFENPENIMGKVRLEISDRDNMGFIAIFSNSLNICCLGKYIKVDAQVGMPISTLYAIVEDFETLDIQDPEIIGTTQISGKRFLTNALLNCCLRPTEETIQVFKDAAASHARYDYKNLSKIDYLENPTQIELLEKMQEEIPFIVTRLKSALSDNKWTLERLVETYGDVVVRVQSETDVQTIREYIAELTTPTIHQEKKSAKRYIMPYTEELNLPEDMHDAFGPSFFSQSDFIAPQLWLGSAPMQKPTSSLTRSPLTKFMCQMVGEKSIELYSADQAEYLYPKKAYNNYQPCWVKPENFDEKLHPLFENAKPISVILKPGELLVQPKGWFHQIHALDSPNMSISHFWKY